MFSKSKNNPTKKSEDVKKSAGKVVDPKRDTPTRYARDSDLTLSQKRDL